MREEISEAVEAIKAVLKHEPSGGMLHCEISDGNLDCIPSAEDIHERRKEQSPQTGKPYTKAAISRFQRCVAALDKLTIDGRGYACQLAHHGEANSWIDEYMRGNGQCPCCDTFNEDELIA